MNRLIFRNRNGHQKHSPTIITGRATSRMMGSAVTKSRTLFTSQWISLASRTHFGSKSDGALHSTFCKSRLIKKDISTRF